MDKYVLTRAERYAVLAIAEKRQRLQAEIAEATQALGDLARELARARGADVAACACDFVQRGEDIEIAVMAVEQGEAQDGA